MAKIKLVTENCVSICFTDITYGTLARHVVGRKVTIPDEFLAYSSTGDEIEQNVNGVLVFAPGVKVSQKISNEVDCLSITFAKKGQDKKTILVPARFVTHIQKVSSTTLMRCY